MKMYRRFLAMLLVGVLFLSCVPAYAITSAEKENNYNAAVLELETYLESYGNDTAALLGISATFDDLHGYAKSTSFVNYISVLMKIADEEYDSDMDFLLSMLEVNEGFKKYLEDMRNDSSIGTINELEAYARARECEHNGNAEDAMENYRQCLDFFDSQHRLTALYNAGNETAYAAALEKIQAGDYAGAYYAFSEISRYEDSAERMKAIVNQLGYTPKDASDNLKTVTGLIIEKATVDQMTLSWQKSSHAQQYEVYYKETNQTEWKHWADTAEMTMTVTGLKQGTSYDFKVIAAIGRLKADEAILANQKTVSVTPTPNPTPTPSPKPTPTLTPSPTPVITGYESGFSYEKSSDDGVTITKYSGNATVLEIPKELGGYKVVSIGNSAFNGCSFLNSVSIPNSVTRIGSSAFLRCINLAKVNIPNSVTFIGSSVFNGCSSLTSVTIPNSVIYLGSQTFLGCSSLTRVIIPDSVTILDTGLFSGCSNLTNVTIPASVNKIADFVFSGCSSLTSITIPDSVSKIADYAFYKSGLTSLTIPTSVTHIGNYAFSECSRLKSISIPNSVTSIGSDAFSWCSSLTRVTIPDSITTISNHAFMGCNNLVSVTIPNSVTKIEGAFVGCSRLTSVTIPTSVTRIGKSAFCDCSNLTNITILNTSTIIEKYAFSGCPNLTIYSFANSTAEKYAKNYGISFKKK